MGRDKAQDRYTYQFVIPEDLHTRLKVLRERFPSLPPAAPMLREALEQYVQMFDDVLSAVERGESQKEIEARLHAALGRSLLQQLGQVAAVQSPPKEVKGSKVEKKKARS